MAIPGVKFKLGKRPPNDNIPRKRRKNIFKIASSRSRSWLPRGRSSRRDGCFVATTVYGCYSHPTVMALRKFRDEKLVSTRIGVWITEIYYCIGPIIANIIGQNEIIKILLRHLLDKIVRLLPKS